MEFEYSKKTKMYMEQLHDFMNKHILPNEQVFRDQLDSGPTRWQVPPIMEDLKAKARERGLWNLFLPESERGAGLTNLEYAPLCEVMGRSPIAPEVFNCSAPDTGNMEVLERYGTAEHKKLWMEPLLEGKIRSAFAMTEPKVASSDATNIESRIERDGDHYVINGHKWWTSGIGDPRCKILIFMGKTDPKNPDKYKQQSMILVPRDTPGIKVLRMLTVFGYDDAPHGHGEVIFENVRVPASNMLLGEGRGFEIAQGRLGPGRIHHCMRQIGVSERALELMCKRATRRVAFGKPLADNDITLERIAESRIEIDQARLLVLHAAYMMDTVGNKAARQAIAEIKVAVPNITGRVVERAMQLRGGGGVSQEFPLASMWAHSRTLRFADGPDEVHRRQIGRLELRKHS
ncbi:MAG TPA: acyl-CoA dehydrogenase family protein [Methylomirabilota bacterium]